MKCPHCGGIHSDSARFCEETGKVIIPPFQYCKNEGCNFRSPLPLSAQFCPNCGKSLFSEFSNITDECRFDEIYSFHEGFAVVKKDNLYGLISSNGDLKLECLYKHILPFSEGLCGICDESDQWIFINHRLERNLILSSEYYVTSDKGFCNGLCSVFKWNEDIEDYLYGYINNQGKEVIKCKYVYADDFEEQHAVVETNDGQSVINKNEEIDLSGWDQIRLCGSYAVCNDFLNRDHTEITDLNSGKNIPLGKGLNVHVIGMGDMKSQICCYYKQDKLVWFNLNNPNNRQSFKQSIETCWDCNFSNGLLCVVLKSNRLSGFINTKGETVIPFIFENAHSFCEGFAAVCLDSKWGYINREGDIVIDCEFDSASEFSEGLAVVTKNGKPFVIDKTGTVVIR